MGDNYTKNYRHIPKYLQSNPTSKHTKSVNLPAEVHDEQGNTSASWRHSPNSKSFLTVKVTVMGRWQIYFYHDKLFFPRITVKAKKWTPGDIVRCTGNAIYDLDVLSPIWFRLANQLRPSRLPMIKSNYTVIPLNVLLDTFELLHCFQAKPNKQPKTMRKAYRKRKLNTSLLQRVGC